MRSPRNKDPYWINARYRGVCHKCKTEIKPGERAWYYPLGMRLLCDGPAQCGQDAAADFNAARADEEVYSR